MLISNLSQILAWKKNLFLISFAVDTLVKTWSPLVWLAPNEKYLPGDVRTFLTHVHAEREKQSNKKIKDIGDNLGTYSNYYQNDGFEDLIYYEGVDAPSVSGGGTTVQNNRKRRNFDKDTSLEYIFELPIDDASENWYLVTNEELGKVEDSTLLPLHNSLIEYLYIFFLTLFHTDSLMKNKSSFIFGENPSKVPIYAVVSMCSGSGDNDFNHKNGEQLKPTSETLYVKQWMMFRE